MSKNIYVVFIVGIIVATMMVSGCTESRDASKDVVGIKEIRVINAYSSGQFKWDNYIIVSNEPCFYEVSGYNKELYDRLNTMVGHDVTITYVSYYRNDVCVKEIKSIDLSCTTDCSVCDGCKTCDSCVR